MPSSIAVAVCGFPSAAVSAGKMDSTGVNCLYPCALMRAWVCCTARAVSCGEAKALLGSQSVAFSACSAIVTSSPWKSSLSAFPLTRRWTRDWNSASISQAACGSSSLRRSTSRATSTIARGKRRRTSRTRRAVGTDQVFVRSSRTAAAGKLPVSAERSSTAPARLTSSPASSKA